MTWKGLAEVVGITAIVSSLIFVGLQLRQDQDIAIAETINSSTESAGTLAMLISENSETWRDGLDGRELSPSEKLKFLSMIRAVETHFFNLFVRYTRLEVNDPDDVARSYAYAIYTHPGLRQAFQRSNTHRAAKKGAFKS